MSAGASLERFGEKYLIFMKWKSWKQMEFIYLHGQFFLSLFSHLMWKISMSIVKENDRFLHTYAKKFLLCTVGSHKLGSYLSLATNLVHSASFVKGKYIHTLYQIIGYLAHFLTVGTVHYYAGPKLCAWPKELLYFHLLNSVLVPAQKCLEWH